MVIHVYVNLYVCECCYSIKSVSQMSRLDVVIFGATGFTGKQTVIHMVEFAKKYQISSWGIAGRSENKLNDVIKEASQKTG